MNILLLYNARSTYTNAVFEHLEAFARFSAHRFFFCHHDEHARFDVDLGAFDAVGIHYSDRVAYDQVSPDAAASLARWPGLKFLFVQDEYERTHRTWHWIRQLGIQLVFTVVPPAGIARVYPPEQFPGVRFVPNLTGYVPAGLPPLDAVPPPSSRTCLVGYRGRPLPLLQWGALASEKVLIGQMMKDACARRGLPHDIAWDEDARIYGARWYEFIASCRAMLGTESGANVFDWDGRLAERVAAWRAAHPGATEREVYDAVVAPQEQPGLMNQVSPRVFEAIGLRTALILFEGDYSGVVRPWEHYIPLRKDGSNLEEVFAHLLDGDFVDAMTQRAWQHVIGSGTYSYRSFIGNFDAELAATVAALPRERKQADMARPEPSPAPTPVTTYPARSLPPGAADALRPPSARERHLARLQNLVVAGWNQVPPGLRPWLRPIARKGMLPAWRALARTAAKLRR